MTRDGTVNDKAASLQPLESWEPIAPGIWKAGIGKPWQELAYTSLAAGPPCAEQLHALPEVPFPFAAGEILHACGRENMIQVRIPAGADEVIYGFGLQLDGIRKTGKVLNLNVDHWSRGGGRTHAPVPFYLSTRGYGVLFNTARFLKAHVQIGNRLDSPNNPAPVDRNPPPEEPAPGPWVAQPPGDAVEAHLTARGLEVVVFAGQDLLDIVSRYNLFCGGGAMPPLWGLGFWHRTPAAYNEQEVEAEVQAFRDHEMPLDVIGLEPGWMNRSYPCTFEWQKHRFPDAPGFVQRMLEQGIRLNLWVNPYVSPEAKIYEALKPFACSHLVWLGIVPDYTIPEARQILCRQHAADHTDIGVSGYKVDEVDGYDVWLWPEHADFPSGLPAESMRQAYGLIMQQMLYRDLHRAADTRTWALVRSSNAGASGLPFVLYSDSYSHAEYITGLSAASLSGVLWSPEVRAAATAEEWRARIQTVCFSPMAMLNAWANGTKPWEYESVTGDVRDVISLRMRLLPYLYTAFADYNRRGIPPMRAMILEASALPASEALEEGELDSVENPYALAATLERDDQFMFGPSILVAPYYEDQTDSREVRLPQGNWHDFYTGEPVGNGITLRVSTPERIPLFVREGAVIPLLSRDIANSAEAYGCPIEVRHYGSPAGECELYEDDGKSFAYENGAYGIRKLRFADGAGTETVLREGPALFGPVERWVQMG